MRSHDFLTKLAICLRFGAIIQATPVPHVVFGRLMVRNKAKPDMVFSEKNANIFAGTGIQSPEATKRASYGRPFRSEHMAVSQFPRYCRWFSVRCGCVGIRAHSVDGTVTL